MPAVWTGTPQLVPWLAPAIRVLVRSASSPPCYVKVLEDVQVRNMVRNPHLAKRISDAGWAAWAAFRTMLEATAACSVQRAACSVQRAPGVR